MKYSDSKSPLSPFFFETDPVDVCPSRLLPAEIDILPRYPNVLPTIHLSTQEAWNLLQSYRIENPVGFGQAACEAIYAHAREQFHVEVVVRDTTPASVVETPIVPAWKAYLLLFSSQSYPSFYDERDPSEPPFGT